MLKSFVKKYSAMILTSLFFFYLGCGLTLSLARIDCADVVNAYKNEYNNVANDLISLEEVEYAVLILTSPDNVEKRDAIRATWANFVSNIILENGEKVYRWNHSRAGRAASPDFIKLLFVVGSKGLDSSKVASLNIENSRSNDLLILDTFQDSYKNLATKMLHSLSWISDNLVGLKYLIKCDDDSFMRIDLIIRDIEAFAPKMDAPEIKEYVSFKSNLPSPRGLYWGYFDGRAHVYLEGKWQEKDWFLCDNYLPYALGGGYVISKSIVDYVGRNYDILSHYNSEDVSMGVWTSALQGINRVHDTRFDTEWKSRGCHKSMLVRHKQTPKDMFEMYRTLTNSQGEMLCKQDSIIRKSYIYKWNVLPTMCCR